MKKRFAVLEVWEALDASKSKEAKRQLLLADDGSSDLVLMNTSSLATPLPDQEQTDDDRARGGNRAPRGACQRAAESPFPARRALNAQVGPGAASAVSTPP